MKFHAFSAIEKKIYLPKKYRQYANSSDEELPLNLLTLSLKKISQYSRKFREKIYVNPPVFVF